MNLHRVRVLVELRRQGTIAAAARALSFVPSAVSQHLSALEREVGMELTRRVGRTVALTDAGHLLADHGERLLADAERAEAALAELEGLRGGRLRVGSFPSAGSSLVPGAFAAFAQQHPGVELSLVEAEPAATLAALVRGEADLAIVYAYAFTRGLDEPALAFDELLDDRLVLAVPPDHPRAGRRARLAQFADERWIAGGTDSPAAETTVQACRRAGFEPAIGFATEDYLVALRLVAHGLGVAFVPRLALAGLHEPVAFARLSDPPARKVLAARRRGAQSAAASEMVRLLRETARALPDPRP